MPPMVPPELAPAVTVALAADTTSPEIVTTPVTVALPSIVTA